MSNDPNPTVAPGVEQIIANHLDFDKVLLLAMTNRQSLQVLSSLNYLKSIQVPDDLYNFPLHEALMKLKGSQNSEKMILKLIEANDTLPNAMNSARKLPLNLAVEFKHTPTVIERIYKLNKFAVNWHPERGLPAENALRSHYHSNVIKMLLPTQSKYIEKILVVALELKREDELIEYIFSKTRQSICTDYKDNSGRPLAEVAIMSGCSTRIMKMFVELTPTSLSKNLLVRSVEHNHPEETVLYLLQKYPDGTKRPIVHAKTKWYPLHYLIAHRYNVRVVQSVLEQSPDIVYLRVSGTITGKHYYYNTHLLGMLLSFSNSDPELIKLVYYAVKADIRVEINVCLGDYFAEENPFVSAIMQKIDYETIRDMYNRILKWTPQVRQKAVFHALEHSNYQEVTMFLLSVFPSAVRELNRMTEKELERLIVHDFVQRDRRYNILKNVIHTPNYACVVLTLLSIDDTIVADSDVLAGYLLQSTLKHTGYREVAERILCINPRAA